jgi:hypothetical protein
VAGRLFPHLTLLIALASLFLQPLVEGIAARGIQDRFGLDSPPRVELESASSLGMLLGRFSDGRVVMQGARIGGVETQRVAVDLDPFDLDVWESVTHGALQTEEPLSGDLRAEVSESEILRLAQESGAPLSGLELREGRVLARSQARVLGVQVPYAVLGDLALRNQDLVFEPHSLSALGAPVPERLADRLLARGHFAYPLREMPRGARLTGVRVMKDRLVLSGEVRGPLPDGG